MVLLSVERSGADNCDVGPATETHCEIRDFAAKSRFCTPKNYAISLVGGQRIENMEMEASFLIHLLGGIGYWAGAICPTIANRQQDTFDIHYQDAIKNAVKVALLALATMRNRYPDVRMS